MTVMLLALIFSDTTLRAGDYRLTGEHEIDRRYEPEPRSREWKPGVDSWKVENRDCPAFFRRELDGVGALSVGPRCEDEEIPYALSPPVSCANSFRRGIRRRGSRARSGS